MKFLNVMVIALYAVVVIIILYYNGCQIQAEFPLRSHIIILYSSRVDTNSLQQWDAVHM